MRSRLLLLAMLAACAAAQAPPPVSISTESLPKAVLHQNYFFELRGAGAQPIAWEVLKGALPPGIALDRASGRLAGAPTAVGEYRFTVGLADSGKPPRAATRELVLRVVAPLTVEWRDYPAVENNNSIRGSVVVTNGTDGSVDLTFVAVAVNETGKAFALGYQHFTLAADSTSPELPLASTVPAGNYVVHVDTVAEAPASGAVHRARLQTPNTLTITGLP